MKRLILILVIVAVAAVITYKLVKRTPEPSAAQPATATATAPPSTQPVAANKTTFYLFHDPTDQDAGCRRIYAFADRAERELGDRVEVKRPDVEREKGIVEQYQVRVLPTILIVAPDGKVEERFEGEEGETAQRIDHALTRIKNAPRS